MRATQALPDGRTRVATLVRRHWPALMFAFTTVLLLTPVAAGKSYSVVPTFQTSTYPWAALPTDLRYEWPQSDQAESSYPWSVHAHRELTHGSLPLWDPFSFGGGTPLFSNGLSAIAYPPQLILRTLFPADVAHDLFMILHLVGAGTFTYLLLRRRRVNRLGAMVAATAWMWGTFPLAWIQLEMVTPVSTLLPLVILLIDRALDRYTIGATLAAGWALAITLTAGNLILMWLVVLTGTAYAASVVGVRCLRRLRTSRSFDLRGLRHLAAMLTVGALGSVLVTLPTYLTLNHSGRAATTYGAVLESSLRPTARLLLLLVPPSLPLDQERMHSMIWYGPIPLALALYGFWSARGRLSWLGRTLAVICLTVVMGTPLTWIAYTFVPGYRFLYPYPRSLFLFGFAVTLLAGLGLNRLSLHPVFGPALSATSPNPGLRVIPALLLFGTLAPLTLYASQINPDVSDRQENAQYPTTPVLRFIRAETSAGGWPASVLPLTLRGPDGRVLRPPLTGGTATVPGIRSFGGYDSAAPLRTAATARFLTGVPIDLIGEREAGYVHPYFLADSLPWDSIANLGVDLILTSPTLPGVPDDPALLAAVQRLGLRLRYNSFDGRVYQVPRSSGLRLVTRVLTADSPSTQARLTLTRPDDAAVLEPGSCPPGEPTTDVSVGTVSVRALAANRAVVEADAGAPSWLVLPINFDPGWSADVSGHGTRLVRADYTRMAVPVPEGRTQVTLTYRPEGGRIGLTISALTAIGSVTVMLLPGLRRRRRILTARRGVDRSQPCQPTVTPKKRTHGPRNVSRRLRRQIQRVVQMTGPG